MGFFLYYWLFLTQTRVVLLIENIFCNTINLIIHDYQIFVSLTIAFCILLECIAYWEFQIYTYLGFEFESKMSKYMILLLFYIAEK